MPRHKTLNCRFINESCFTWDECDVYNTVSASKNVFGVQYCDANQVGTYSCKP
jgi:hypothetical protein